MAPERLWRDAAAYVRLLLGADFRVRPANPGVLPAFLTDKYEIREVELLHQHMLVLAVAGRELEGPTALAKHVALVRGVTRRPVLLLTDAVSAYARQRLIQERVNFLVPGNQLFLPELGADLREHFRTPGRETLDHLTPAAQLIVFGQLLRDDLNGCTARQLAGIFQYTPMSIGRALDELEEAGAVELKPSGRERRIRFSLTPADLWKAVRPRVQSPIRTVRHVHQWPAALDLPWAGEMALAERTDLSPPRRPVVAVAARVWKTLALQEGLSPADPDDRAVVDVQTWSYDPRVLQNGRTVDPISLYLSLQDRPDERVRMAADALMEPFNWFTA